MGLKLLKKIQHTFEEVEFTGVDITIGEPSDIMKAYRALIMQDGPFDVQIDTKVSFIGKHEITAARAIMRKYCTNMVILTATGAAAWCTEENVVSLVAAFAEFVKSADSTQADEWGWELQIYAG